MLSPMFRSVIREKFKIVLILPNYYSKKPKWLSYQEGLLERKVIIVFVFLTLLPCKILKAA